MAGNTTKIDEVVDEVAITQFNQLKTAGKELRTELSALLQSAIDLNAALGGSTPASFAKNLKASTDATNKIIANNNKQIENEQAKAAKQEQILNKYLVMLSKQEAARKEAEAKQQQRDAKEIAAAEAKAAKLAVIAEKQATELARKATVQFPTGPTAGYNPVTAEPDTASTRYQPIITGNEQMAISANKSAEAIAEENAALLEQKEVMDSLSTSYRANIELLLTLQVERAENAAALKALTVEDAASGERMVFLTAEQLRLKTAIQQTNLTLSQQTKQMLAADTSTAQNQARLDELRVAYNNLTVAEQQNVAIGGVWLAEIERLDVAVKQAAVSQGVYNKNVGNYSTAVAFAEKVSAKFYTQLVRLAAQFLLITVIFGAVTWLYDLIKNMDIFTGRLDKAKQAWEAWSGVVQDASKNAGAAVIKLEILNKAAQDINETDKQRLAAVKALRDLEGDRIKGLSDEAIMTGALNGQIKELTASLEKQAIAEAGFKKLTDIESKIIDQKTLQGKLEAVRVNSNKLIDQGRGSEVGGALGMIPGGDKMGKDFQKNIVNQDIDGQLKDTKETLAVLENSKNILEKNIGLSDLAKAAEDKTKKAKKEPKSKDYGNTDLLEANRIDIEEAKKRNKAIFLDDSYSHDARLVALDQYLKKSKELLDNSAEIIKADTNMRAQQRLNGLKKLKNEELDIENERIIETERLHKEELEKRKKAVAEIVTADKQGEQEQLEVLNQGAILAQQALTDAKDKQINAKIDARTENKISEKQYNRDVLLINDDYNVKRLAQELTVQKQILAIKEAYRDKEVADATSKGATPEEISKIKSDANRGIEATTNKIAEIGGQLGNAITKQKADKNTKGETDKEGEKKKIEQAATDLTIQGINEINDLRQKSFEAEIARLEKRAELIDQNAQLEKDAIGRTLDTQSNKAREIAVLDAKTASQHKAIAAEEAKLKHKAAVADKEATIAKIVATGALAVVSAFATQPAYLGIILGAIVAASVAAELATAIATPIPQYAAGTPIGGHKGGRAIVGDGGGPERITEPGKPAYYSTGVATMVSLPRGTVVEPYKMLPETPKWSSTRSDNAGVIDGLNRVERAVSGQKQGNTRLSGWVEAQRQADAWNRTVSNHFK